MSLHVYLTHPEANEETLHNVRKNHITNDFLENCAIQRGLPPFIQGSAFSAKHWRPPGYRVVRQGDDMTSGRPDERQPGSSSVQAAGSNKQADDSQRLDHKAIADVMEAIIGAAYLTGGINSAIQVAKCLGVPLEGISCWSDFRRIPRTPVIPSSAHHPFPQLETIIGCPARKPELLAEVLVCGLL